MRTLTVALILVIGSGALGAASPAAASNTSMAAQLEALANGFPGGSAIWVSDPSLAAPLYAREPDRELVAASLYKLALLAETERRVDRGELRYEDTIVIDAEDLTADGSWVGAGATLTIDEALELMITVSDNGTAVHFWRMLGAVSVNALLAQYGITGFHLAADWSEDHVVTARSVASFYTLLAKRQLVSAKASDRMLERLERQQINDRIPAQLPEGTRVAHKTGDLVGVVHDAGIVFTPRGPRVIVGMTWDADEASADEFIAHVASTVYSETSSPPLAARYRAPEMQYAETGGKVVLDVAVQNAGSEAWTATGARRVGLLWELRDPASAVVSRAGSVALGSAAPGDWISRRFVVTVPKRAGDLTLVVGLADASGRALAPQGVATATVIVAARPRVPELALAGPAFAR